MPYFSWAHLNPYQAHRAAFAFHRGPRRFFPRLLWFGIGAGSYAMWTRHAEAKRQVEDGSSSSEYRLARAPSSSQRSRTNVESPAEGIREVGEQAGSAISEASLTALDALTTSLQTLKAKLAETREQHELERDGDKLYLEQRLPTDEDNFSSSRSSRSRGF
ncbi:hypothetical protein SCHPADRAFT_901779 [Schizopora paradoxa]|uniref:Uncharacterized protein n=1 Tax=Schizopora paradoxa TaxID=27342 RepID=A0A0H2RWU8_9AGAM|nr:hypothetical protein SCHPADRAFT_901779 [Schizopora paradoxa]